LPSHSFLDGSVDVRPCVSVAEVGEAVVADDCIDLKLSPLLDFWYMAIARKQNCTGETVCVAKISLM